MRIRWKKVLDQKFLENIKPKLEPIFDSRPNDRNVLIRIKNLKQVFGTGKNKKIVYEHVNLDICDGEILAILGSNGAGKTTLVESISGIISPSKGKIEFKYTNLNTKNSTNKKYEKVGVQFQDLAFPSGITIKDILSFIVGMNDCNLTEKEVSLILEKFHLKEFLNLQAGKLSGGQQQRLNVMIAMLSKPKVLFLDEFTTGLDIDVKNRIKNFILEFAKEHGIIIVIISHDIDIINEIVDRIVIIAEQKIMVDAYRKTLENRFGSIPAFLKKYIV